MASPMRATVDEAERTVAEGAAEVLQLNCVVSTGAAASSTDNTVNSSIGSPSKKRECEELLNRESSSSPPSNKKTKESDPDAAASVEPQEFSREGKDAHGALLSSSSMKSLPLVDSDPIGKHKMGNARPLSDSTNIKAGETDESHLERLEKTDSECAGGQSTNNQYPMRDIRFQTKSDVMFLSGCNSHPGNIKYKQLLTDKRADYLASNRNERTQIVMEIIDEIRSQDPPGRFLKLSQDKPYYFDVGDEFVRKKIIAVLGKGSRGGTNKNKKNRESDESNLTAVSCSDEDKLGANKKSGTARKASSKGDVRPHHNDSVYNDVLSFFASTPFDSESMRSLREQKEGSSTNKIMRENLAVPPSRANLPIVSQKQFMNTKAPPSTVAEEGSSLHDDAKASSKPSSGVEKEVSKFLLEEAKHLADAAAHAQRKETGSSFASTTASASNVARGKSPENSFDGPNPVILSNGHKPPTEPSLASNLASTNSSQPTNGLDSKEIETNVDTVAQTEVELAQVRLKVAKPNLRVSIGGCTAAGIPLVTPKTPKTPSTNKSGSSNTPKTPRTPAILLSTNTTPSGLPEGWMTRTFQRASGKSSGHKDTYFYSPHKNIKFRAMKGCKAFLNILNEPGVDGNEAIALKVFKERGHRC